MTTSLPRPTPSTSRSAVRERTLATLQSNAAKYRAAGFGCCVLHDLPCCAAAGLINIDDTGNRKVLLCAIVPKGTKQSEGPRRMSVADATVCEDGRVHKLALPKPAARKAQGAPPSPST